MGKYVDAFDSNKYHHFFKLDLVKDVNIYSRTLNFCAKYVFRSEAGPAGLASSFMLEDLKLVLGCDALSWRQEWSNSKSYGMNQISPKI
jgi:hypothetical protein